MRTVTTILLITLHIIGFSQSTIKELLLQADKNQNSLPSLIDIYSNILRLDSCNFEALLGQGQAYYNRWSILGKVDKVYLDSAFIQLNKACNVKDPDYRAFVARGDFFADFNKYQDAFNDFNKAIALNPDLIYVRWQRAEIFIKWHDYKNALTDLDYAIKNYGQDYDWLYRYRALCYANLGMLKKCKRDVQKVLSIDSIDNDNILCIADYYAISGEYKKAIKKYSYIINRNDAYALAYLKRGSAYAAIGMNDNAQKDWNIAARKGILVNEDSKKIKFGRY